MTTFAILISIGVGAQLAFWILALSGIIRSSWSGGKKTLWIVIVLILGPLGTLLYLLAVNKLKEVLIFLALSILPIFAAFIFFFNPSTERVGVYDSGTNEVADRSLSTNEQIELSAGDRMTLALVEVLIRDLEAYRTINGVYPTGGSVLIGSGNAQQLRSTGFSARAEESGIVITEDLRHPSAGKDEAFGNMVYSATTGGQSYRITFALAVGTTRYTAGSHFASPLGIDK